MTLDQKRQFITCYCNTIRDEMLKKVEHMPDVWDGHELRALASRKFEWEVSDLMKNPRTRRFREYERAVLQNDL